MFKKRIDIDKLVAMTPTSKFDLKMQCLAIANGNVDEAMKLYGFVADGLDIPDVTTPPPTTMQQVKAMAGNVFGWVKENKDDIVGIYDLVKNLRKGNAVEAAAEVVNELPPLK